MMTWTAHDILISWGLATMASGVALIILSFFGPDEPGGKPAPHKNKPRLVQQETKRGLLAVHAPSQ